MLSAVSLPAAGLLNLSSSLQRLASLIPATRSALPLDQIHLPQANVSDAEGVKEKSSIKEEVGTVDETHKLKRQKYKYGFISAVEAETLPKGLDEQRIRQISTMKGEPDWLLQYWLNAFQKWKQMKPPKWANLQLEDIDFQNMSYYSAPKKKPALKSLDEVDPEILKTFEKLGIPLDEQRRLTNVAVDAIFDSTSVATTFQRTLKEAGVIFCSISEAVKEYPDLVRKYLGSVVPVEDNYYAALNAAVFTDGTFVYLPKGVQCPMELSTYFRINDKETGQFERTLIVADEGSIVSYLEGCTAPENSKNQLHAAVVELVALDKATIKYSTVQNWYPGDEDGRGGIYNFVTKRGLCKGRESKIIWTQVEAGSAITWKYPSCVLQGDGSVGEFYSVALTNGKMQADTGTKMVHVGRNTKSTIISKGISAERSHNSYRGLVSIHPTAANARNYTQCDSMLVGKECSANTFPVIRSQNASGQIEHEASTCKLSEEQLLYLRCRGLDNEEAIRMVVNGFAHSVLTKLPMEFAAEADKLLTLKLANSVG